MIDLPDELWVSIIDYLTETDLDDPIYQGRIIILSRRWIQDIQTLRLTSRLHCRLVSPSFARLLGEVAFTLTPRSCSIIQQYSKNSAIAPHVTKLTFSTALLFSIPHPSSTVLNQLYQARKDLDNDHNEPPHLKNGRNEPQQGVAKASIDQWLSDYTACHENQEHFCKHDRLPLLIDTFRRFPALRTIQLLTVHRATKYTKWPYAEIALMDNAALTIEQTRQFWDILKYLSVPKFTGSLMKQVRRPDTLPLEEVWSHILTAIGESGAKVTEISNMALEPKSRQWYRPFQRLDRNSPALGCLAHLHTFRFEYNSPIYLPETLFMLYTRAPMLKHLAIIGAGRCSYRDWQALETGMGNIHRPKTLIHPRLKVLQIFNAEIQSEVLQQFVGSDLEQLALWYLHHNRGDFAYLPESWFFEALLISAPSLRILSVIEVVENNIGPVDLFRLRTHIKTLAHVYVPTLGLANAAPDIRFFVHNGQRTVLDGVEGGRRSATPEYVSVHRQINLLMDHYGVTSDFTPTYRLQEYELKNGLEADVDR